jgi:hypothetical protein
MEGIDGEKAMSALFFATMVMLPIFLFVKIVVKIHHLDFP